MSQQNAATEKRGSINEVLGTDMSVARTTNVLKHHIINGKVDELRLPFEETVAKYDATKKQLENGKIPFSANHVVNGTKQRVTGERDMSADERAAAEKVASQLEPLYHEALAKKVALSAVRFRVSYEAGVSLSVAADEITRELLLHGMKSAAAAESTMVKVKHIHNDGIEKLPLYPLYSGLSIFKETGRSVVAAEIAERHAKELHAARKEAVKEFKTKNGVHAKKQKKDVVAPAPAPAAPVESTTDAAESEDDKKSPFTHYINKVKKTLLNQFPELKNLKLKAASECVKYVSDIIENFISRIGQLAVTFATDALGNKTISNNTVMTIIKMFLTDGHQAKDTITLKSVMVPHPDSLKAEEKKALEEKKAGRAYKINHDALPKVPGFEAERVITFPTSYYDTFSAEVARKVALIPKKEKTPAPSPTTN